MLKSTKQNTNRSDYTQLIRKLQENMIKIHKFLSKLLSFLTKKSFSVTFFNKNNNKKDGKNCFFPSFLSIKIYFSE